MLSPAQLRQLQEEARRVREVGLGFGNYTPAVSEVPTEEQIEVQEGQEVSLEQIQQDQEGQTVGQGITAVPASLVRVIGGSLPHGEARVGGGTLQRGLRLELPPNLDEEARLPRAYPTRPIIGYRHERELQERERDERLANQLRERVLMAGEAADTTRRRADELTAEAERLRREVPPSTTLDELRYRIRRRE